MPVPPHEAAWNATTIAEFRAHGGQITTGPLTGVQLLLLTTTGARTGAPQTSPLGYTRDGERYVVVGSNSGGPKDPAWVLNVLANPRVTVEVGPDTFTALATVHEGAEWRRMLDAHIAAIPMFGTYEGMTGRNLPVVTLERIDDSGATATAG